MKREMDLVRAILIKMEADGSVGVISGYSDQQVGHHVYLMIQAGLLEGAEDTSLGDLDRTAIPYSITWAGHEFLDAARNESVWDRTKAIIAERGGSMAFDVVKALLMEVAKHAVLGP
jgi:hypothetical protein